MILTPIETTDRLALADMRQLWRMLGLKCWKCRHSTADEVLATRSPATICWRFRWWTLASGMTIKRFFRFMPRAFP